MDVLRRTRRNAYTIRGAVAFSSGWSMGLSLVRGSVDLVLRLSSEHHPAVQRGCAFLAAGTRFDPHSVRDSFNDIAETYLLFMSYYHRVVNASYC
jgi:hypothetical protein